MQIFVSHASEQQSEADRLAIALRGRGHEVFLDSEDLPPASDYQSRIEQAIAACDLFCFLISSHSIAPKRFTLSELNIARRRWPNPVGRVLPVMVEKVPMDAVPPYLRAVSILVPEGDLVADVLGGIDEMRPRARPWQSPLVLGAAAAFVLLIAAAVVLAPRASGWLTGRNGNGAAGTSPGAPGEPASPAADRGGPTLSIPALDRVRTMLARYVLYLKDVGFGQLDEKVTVHLYSKEMPLPGDLRDQSESVNAFYFDRGIYVHWSMSNDMTVFLREYTHQALLQTAGGNTMAGSTAIESALADYLPASFLGTPLIGEGLGSLLHLPTSYIRRLDNTLAYPDVSEEPHDRGEVWAGALWACRQSLGQAAVDRAPVQAWIATAATAREAGFEARFGAALQAKAAAPAGRCFADEVGRRQLPH